VPVWFGAPWRASPAAIVGNALRFNRAILELATILSSRLGIGLAAAYAVAKEASSSFAKKVGFRRWLFFYYLDPESHTVYTNNPALCHIEAADMLGGRVVNYGLDDDDCGPAYALLVLEEELEAISRLLSERLGLDRSEAEASLREAVEALKADPENAVRAGLARLILLPLGSEEELGRELLKYVLGAFQDWELAEAWRRVVKPEYGGPTVLADAFTAYLAGRGAGYEPPDGYKVCERGDIVMLAGPGGGGWGVAWFKVRGNSWVEVESAEGLDWSVQRALEDLVVEDFKRGLPPARIAGGVECVHAFGFAAHGYLELARAVYRVVAGRRVYTKVVEGRRGESLVIHVVRGPGAGSVCGGLLLLVEYAGHRYLLDDELAIRALWSEPEPKLAFTPEEYASFLDKYRGFHATLAGKAARVLGNSRVRAELPSDVASWLQAEISTERP